MALFMSHLVSSPKLNAYLYVSSSKTSSSSKQQSIVAIYRKYGKCEYTKYSASVGNNDMQAYNKNGLTTWFNCRESI
jgi:hypothetical protein